MQTGGIIALWLSGRDEYAALIKFPHVFLSSSVILLKTILIIDAQVLSVSKKG
jgi:hypothetical protein